MDFFTEVSTQHARNRPFTIDTTNTPRRVFGEVALLFSTVALFVTSISLLLPPVS